MKLLSLIIGIGCLGLIGISSTIYAQEESSIEYEVVTRLEIPGASGATWSPDGSRLAVTAWPMIQIWDTERWELLLTITDAPAYSTKWNPTGDMLAGVRGGRDESILIWNPTTGEVLKEMTRPRLPEDRGIFVLHDLAWSPDGSRIATDSARIDVDLLLMWDLEAENNPQPLVVVYPDMLANDWINIAELEWSRNGRWLLASGADGNFRSRSIIHLFDATTGETVRTIFPGFHPVWGPNDEQFAGLSIKNDVYVINIWDTDTGEILSTFKAHENGTLVMSWNFHTDVIAGVGFEDHLILWDVETGVRYDIDSVQTPFAGSVDWRSNSDQLAIADLDEGVVILNFEFSE